MALILKNANGNALDFKNYRYGEDESGVIVNKSIAYLGHSTDADVRWKASSGGIGTSIVKYLFDTAHISHVLSLSYDEKTLCYWPQFVDAYSKYMISASVYQDVNIVAFCAKEFVKMAGAKILIFALPCQTSALRKLASRHRIDITIIGLVCSSQQTMDATFYLLRRLGIKKNDVLSIRYRGNGWPSGVQVALRNGETKFLPNNFSLWKKIFHSRLFAPKRCLYCGLTKNENADITLADPWGIVSPESETAGQTLFVCNTIEGSNIISKMLQSGYIEAMQVNSDALEKSQAATLLRKSSMKNVTHLRNCYLSLCKSKSYRELVTFHPRLFSLHCRLIARLERLIQQQGFHIQ